MTTPHHSYLGISQEEVRLLQYAAHVERAQAIRRMLQRLFRRPREAQAWPASDQPVFGVNPCR